MEEKIIQITTPSREEYVAFIYIKEGKPSFWFEEIKAWGLVEHTESDGESCYCVEPLIHTWDKWSLDTIECKSQILGIVSNHSKNDLSVKTIFKEEIESYLEREKKRDEKRKEK